MSEEQQAQQLMQQLQMLENHFTQLAQQENTIVNIIREANSAIQSISETKTKTESDSLVPIGMGVYIKSKIQSKEKIIIDVGSGVAVEKDQNSAINWLESRLKELEIALQNVSSQRKQVADNLEIGKQQMQNIMQKAQMPKK
jgi:prefoldin alpha subunit|tara:strand:- start:983 stop:1408 length:426 start_codon:yes stop_codon:yes gene_type:complete